LNVRQFNTHVRCFLAKKRYLDSNYLKTNGSMRLKRYKMKPCPDHCFWIIISLQVFSDKKKPDGIPVIYSKKKGLKRHLVSPLLKKGGGPYILSQSLIQGEWGERRGGGGATY
jgi:hypothetical protein